MHNQLIQWICLALSILTSAMLALGHEEELLKLGDKIGASIENHFWLTQRMQLTLITTLYSISLLGVCLTAQPRIAAGEILFIPLNLWIFALALKLKPRKEGVKHPWRRGFNQTEHWNIIRICYYTTGFMDIPMHMGPNQSNWSLIPLHIATILLLTYPLCQWTPIPKTQPQPNPT